MISYMTVGTTMLIIVHGIRSSLKQDWLTLDTGAYVLTLVT